MPLIVTHVNQAGSDLPYPEDVFYSSSADIDTIADIDLVSKISCAKEAILSRSRTDEPF
jgi:hypothetical protein